MANIKVKDGWEGKFFFGLAGKKVIKAKLGEISEADLQAILDGDPANASKFIDGTPSKKASNDNKPGEPAPAAPEAPKEKGK